MPVAKRVFFDEIAPLLQVDANVGDLIRELNYGLSGLTDATGLRIQAQGSTTFNLLEYTADADGRKTIPILSHQLGYQPIFLVYYFSDSNDYYASVPFLVTAPSGVQTIGTNVTAMTDSKQLYVVFQGSAQTPQQSFYYFLFDKPESS